MTTTDAQPSSRAWMPASWARIVHPTPLCGAPHPGHPGHTCRRSAGHLRDGLHWSLLGEWPDEAPRQHGYVTIPHEGVYVVTTRGVVHVDTDTVTVLAICLPDEGAAWIRVLKPVHGVMRAKDMPPWGVW